MDVEEADGIQDIGETFTTILGDEVVGEGSEEDFGTKVILLNFIKTNLQKIQDRIHFPAQAQIA